MVGEFEGQLAKPKGYVRGGTLAEEEEVVVGSLRPARVDQTLHYLAWNELLKQRLDELAASVLHVFLCTRDIKEQLHKFQVKSMRFHGAQHRCLEQGRVIFGLCELRDTERAQFQADEQRGARLRVERGEHVERGRLFCSAAM